VDGVIQNSKLRDIDNEIREGRKSFLWLLSKIHEFCC